MTKLHPLLIWLIKHKKKPSDPKQYRAYMLTWLLLFSFLITAVVLVHLLIGTEETSPNRRTYIVLILAIMILLALTFSMNRRGHYYISAGLFVACAVIGPWGSLLLDPAVFSGDFVPLVYVSLSVLLSSILLPLFSTISLAALQITGLAFVLLHSPASKMINIPSFLAYIFFFSGLSIISNLLSKRDMDEINHQRSQLMRIAAKLKEQSIRDHLTNLFNRRYMEWILVQEILRASERQISIGVIMLDIDHFKKYNDTLGHAAGDKLLIALGKFLLQQVRIVDSICRYGGDEFVIVLPGASYNAVQDIAEKLRINVKKAHMDYPDLTVKPISISQGAVLFPDHGSTKEELLEAADTALYRAKREGRDRVVIAELDG